MVLETALIGGRKGAPPTTTTMRSLGRGAFVSKLEFLFREGGKRKESREVLLAQFPDLCARLE